MTAHFSIAELSASDFAVRNRLANRPPDEAVPNLRRLMAKLEEIRAALGGRPITVTSGYRSPGVNRGVGGSRNSAHMDGRAADIKVSGLAPREAAQQILAAGIALDQLIYEGQWVHVGIAREAVAPRGEVLTARFTASGVHYLQGIV
jgi:hypothetical protein